MYIHTHVLCLIVDCKPSKAARAMTQSRTSRGTGCQGTFEVKVSNGSGI